MAKAVDRRVKEREKQTNRQKVFRIETSPRGESKDALSRRQPNKKWRHDHYYMKIINKLSLDFSRQCNFEINEPSLIFQRHKLSSNFCLPLE